MSDDKPIDDNTWRRVKEVFGDALEKPASEHPAFLDEQCRGDARLRLQVEQLLAAHVEGVDFMASPTQNLATGGEVVRGIGAAASAPPEGLHSTIGPYKLLQEIGEGGFGVVYMAEQTEPLRRKVALKIIKLGMDTRQVVGRFEAERQALAMMDHPNIAKVFDAGATESGRPYFVMELVKGVPITEYCDINRSTTRERLELFMPICWALQHAHQKGIIHRDIKPSNILVTLHDGKPVPKVIDFGIAKATNAHLTEKTVFTEFRQMLGTPLYMSPEQAEMSGLDLDTRTDVYSLGVVLYELLTGMTPFDQEALLGKAYGEIQRIIREDEPAKPSTRISTLGRAKVTAIARHRRVDPRGLGNLLHGELDWIIMKSLEKDRTRRYDTAADFARDLQRHLQHVPVEAGPPSRVYRLRKALRRHRVAVFTGAVIALALLSGTIAATAGYLEANRQKVIAVRERDAKEEARARESELRVEAEEARDAKEKALRRSEGMRLLAQSQTQLSEDPGLALLLAIEGAQRHPGLLANSTLLDALEEAPRRELILDAAEVTRASLDPLGRRVATGHGDGTVRVWSVESGALLLTLRGHAEWVSGVYWVRSTGRLVTVSQKTVRVWDPETGSELRAIDVAGDWTVTDLDEDGRRAVARNGQRQARAIFNLESGEVEQVLSEDQQYLGFAPDGQHVLSKTRRKQPPELHLRDLDRGEIVHTWTTCNNPSAAFHPAGKTVLVSTEDRQACLRDLGSGDVIRRFESPDASLRALGFTPDGTRAIASGESIHVWDVATARLIHSLDISMRGDTRFHISRDGRRLAAVHIGEEHQSLRIWNLETGTHLYGLPRGDWEFAGIEFSPDGTQVLSVTDGTARIWDPVPGRERSRFKGSCSRSALYPSPDGRQFASAPRGLEPARVWDFQTRRAVQVLDDHMIIMNNHRKMWTVWSVAFSRDGTRMATCGLHSRVVVWDRVTGRRVLCLWERHEKPTPTEGAVWSVDFSPDGRRFVTAGDDRVARVWDTETGDLLLELGNPRTEHNGILWIDTHSAVYSPDGKQILTRLKVLPSGEEYVFGTTVPQVWDATTGRLRHELAGHQGSVSRAAYSPDGKWIETSGASPSSRNWTTRIWSAETGGCLHVLEGGGEGLTGFSADSAKVVAPVGGEGVRIYDVFSGRHLQTLPFADGELGYASFSPDDRTALAVGRDGTLLAWRVDSGELVLRVRGVDWVGASSTLFTPDSSAVGMTTKEGVLRVVPLDPLRAAIAGKPRELTAEEREEYELGEPSPTFEGTFKTTPRAGELDRGALPHEDPVRDVASRFSEIFPNEEQRAAAVSKVRELHQVLGIDANIAWAVFQLAYDLQDEDQLDAAERVYAAALAEAQARLGGDHATTDRVRQYFAGLLVRNKKYDEAERLARLLIAKGRGVWSDRVLHILGESLLGQGRYAEAEAPLREALAIREKIEAGPRAENKSLLGACLVGQGRYEDGEGLLLEAYDKIEEVKKAEALERVVRLYDAWGQTEKAAEWKAKLKASAGETGE